MLANFFNSLWKFFKILGYFFNRIRLNYDFWQNPIGHTVSNCLKSEVPKLEFLP